MSTKSRYFKATYLTASRMICCGDLLNDGVCGEVAAKRKKIEVLLGGKCRPDWHVRVLDMRWPILWKEVQFFPLVLALGKKKLIDNLRRRKRNRFILWCIYADKCSIQSLSFRCDLARPENHLAILAIHCPGNCVGHIRLALSFSVDSQRRCMRGFWRSVRMSVFNFTSALFIIFFTLCVVILTLIVEALAESGEDGIIRWYFITMVRRMFQRGRRGKCEWCGRGWRGRRRKQGRRRLKERDVSIFVIAELKYIRKEITLFHDARKKAPHAMYTWWSSNHTRDWGDYEVFEYKIF